MDSTRRYGRIRFEKSPWAIPPATNDGGFWTSLIHAFRRSLADSNRLQQRLVRRAAASGQPETAARLAGLFWSGQR